MDIKTACIFVERQSKALTFYTGILGLWKVNDIDLGEFRWLTASTVGSVEIEFLLKSNVASSGENLSGSDLCRWHIDNSD